MDLTEQEMVELVDKIKAKEANSAKARKKDRAYAHRWLWEWAAYKTDSTDMPNSGSIGFSDSIKREVANIDGWDDPLTYYRSMIFDIDTWITNQSRKVRDMIEYEYRNFRTDRIRIWCAKYGLGESSYEKQFKKIKENLADHIRK